MMDLWLAPWRASLSLTASTLEMMLTAQKSFASAQGVPDFQPMDEIKMREAFHTAADANLRRWGDTADAINNLPEWYRDLSRVPGGVMTDWFDKARRVTQA
jgi:predicted PolB exonuclease-like 3'-5' exonuclease